MTTEQQNVVNTINSPVQEDRIVSVESISGSGF